jgi:hypothetical protein
VGVPAFAVSHMVDQRRKYSSRRKENIMSDPRKTKQLSVSKKPSASSGGFPLMKLSDIIYRADFKVQNSKPVQVKPASTTMGTIDPSRRLDNNFESSKKVPKKE